MKRRLVFALLLLLLFTGALLEIPESSRTNAQTSECQIRRRICDTTADGLLGICQSTNERYEGYCQDIMADYWWGCMSGCVPRPAPIPCDCFNHMGCIPCPQ